MEIDHKCPGLINSSDEYGNKTTLRIAVLNDCYFTMVNYFNDIIKAIKVPFILTHCDGYGQQVNGEWTGIVGELVSNRSDLSATVAEINYDYYQNTMYSPIFTAGNAITILTGKILANSNSGLWIMKSFSTLMWQSFFTMIVGMSFLNGILHQKYSPSWKLYSIDVLECCLKIWAVFLNQSNQFGSNICCHKHLIVLTLTVISIFVMSLSFNSEILSNLLFHPLIKIDTLDDLVKYIKENKDVEIVSDNMTTTWNILRDWQDERVQFIFKRMKHEPFFSFSYEKVYHGKTIIISFDKPFDLIMNANKDLSFQISSDRLVGMQYAIMYSKHIDIEIKRFIDSRMSCLFESGIYNFKEDAKMTRHLDIEEEEGDQPQSISISYFIKLLIIFSYAILILIFILLIEFLIFFYDKHHKKYVTNCQNCQVYRRKSYQLSLISKILGNIY